MSFDRMLIVLMVLLPAGLSVSAAPVLPGPQAAATATATATALPEPLTLSYALSLADNGHPAVLARDAALQSALADQSATTAERQINATVSAGARLVEPHSSSRDQQRGDHFALLSVEKRLFDFGQTAAREQGAAAEVERQRWQLLDTRQQHRLQIMQYFFAALEADLAYQRDNEAMSIAYIRLDRARDRVRLGQESDVQLARFENDYRTLLSQRMRSELAQRASRSRLALVLNHPGMLPSELVPVDGPTELRPVPDIETLERQALAGNARIQAQRQRVRAAQAQLQAARTGYNPVVNAALEAARYRRSVGARDPLRIGVTVDVPLYTGDRKRSAIARAQAEFQRAQAELAETRFRVRQEVLDISLELEALALQRDEVQSLVALRDIELSRNRALYELEVASDFGDAMARQSAARLALVRNDHALLLAWARLDALTGQLDGQGERP